MAMGSKDATLSFGLPSKVVRYQDTLRIEDETRDPR